MSLRDAVLNSSLKEEILHVPEWGLDVLVREMTGKIRSRFVEMSMKQKFETMYPEIVIACAFDPATKKEAFDPADRDTLNRASGAALDRICNVALRLSGLTAGSVETAEKNSSAASAEPTL